MENGFPETEHPRSGGNAPSGLPLSPAAPPRGFVKFIKGMTAAMAGVLVSGVTNTGT